MTSSLQTAKLPNLTTSLINTLRVANGLTLTEDESNSIAMEIIKLDFQTVLYADKIFQAVKTPQGKKDTFKIICGLLTFFSQATKVKQQLTSSEVIMCTDWIMRTYTHDSVEDVALALKDAIFGGHKFYGSVTIADVRAIIETYINEKCINLEKTHLSTINDPSTFTHSPIIKQLLHKNTDNVDNYVSFVEVFDNQQRAKIAKQHAESLARLPKIIAQNEYFRGVEMGAIPAYQIVIDDDFEKLSRETEKFMRKKQTDGDKKFGWFKS